MIFHLILFMIWFLLNFLYEKKDPFIHFILWCANLTVLLECNSWWSFILHHDQLTWTWNSFDDFHSWFSQPLGEWFKSTWRLKLMLKQMFIFFLFVSFFLLLSVVFHADDQFDYVILILNFVCRCPFNFACRCPFKLLFSMISQFSFNSLFFCSSNLVIWSNTHPNTDDELNSKPVLGTFFSWPSIKIKVLSLWYYILSFWLILFLSIWNVQIFWLTWHFCVRVNLVGVDIYIFSIDFFFFNSFNSFFSKLFYFLFLTHSTHWILILFLVVHCSLVTWLRLELAKLNSTSHTNNTIQLTTFTTLTSHCTWISQF